jgi:putative transposase
MLVARKATDHESIRSLTSRIGIPRSTYYYHPKQPAKDWALRQRIEVVLAKNPSYGPKRIAPKLGISKNRVERVMKLYGIRPYRKRGRKWRKAKDNEPGYPNLLTTMDFPCSVKRAWVSDFTHLSFHGRFVYLATIMDIFNREIVGWNIAITHTTPLVLGALINAITKHGRPEILHSDQGSEYKSKLYTSFAKTLGIRLSMSAKLLLCHQYHLHSSTTKR